LAEAALAIHAANSGPNHPWTVDAARVTADALDALQCALVGLSHLIHWLPDLGKVVFLLAWLPALIVYP
jgi:hypothetical protein